MTFDFYLGGYGRNSFRFSLEGTTLRCSEFYGIPLEEDKFISVEANKDWEQVVNFLESSNWRRRYDSDILDGTQWELKAKASGLHVNSYGSNSFPEDFNRFLILLNRVIEKAGVQVTA